MQVTGPLGDQKQQQEKELNEKVAAVMRQKLRIPVKVVLKEDNCIKQVNTHDNDEEWSLNIKRGLVNLFQIAPRQGEQQGRERAFVTQLEVSSWFNA